MNKDEIMLANHKDKGLVMFRTKNKELARAGCKESKFRIRMRMREKKRRANRGRGLADRTKL